MIFTRDARVSKPLSRSVREGKIVDSKKWRSNIGGWLSWDSGAVQGLANITWFGYSDFVSFMHRELTEPGEADTNRVLALWRQIGDLGGLPTFVQTSHEDVYPAIDPTLVKLSRPSIVCVVGASRGIGAGIAKAYAKASATGLVLASRQISDLEAAAASCKQLDRDIEIEIVECDITSAGSVSELAKKIKVRFGSLDVVVVNSGVSGPIVPKLTDADPATFQQAIDVKYTGLFLSAKFLLPILLGAQDGAKNFITVSSFAALIIRGPFANAQYCVSKLAQLKLMEHMHEQYHDEGLLSWSVHPGSVDSELAAATPEPFKAYLTDSLDLCGGFCTWLSSAGTKRAWLCGRLVNAKYDVSELEAKKDEVVEKDLLKLKMIA